MPNLIKLPNKMPIINSLKTLISKVNFSSRSNKPNIVIMLLRPIFMPKPLILNGNKASTYDTISIKDNSIMLKVNLLICVNFLFDIIINI